VTDPRDDPGFDPRAEIARLESEMEALGETVARCRKIAVAAKAAIVAGFVWIAMMFAGLIAADGLALLLAIILPLGGIVLYGSNDTTAKQAKARIEAAARRRSELINAIDLRVVAAPPMMLN
jgi:hypothetical protein